jgi:hypothetical protein
MNKNFRNKFYSEIKFKDEPEDRSNAKQINQFHNLVTSNNPKSRQLSSTHAQPPPPTLQRDLIQKGNLNTQLKTIRSTSKNTKRMIPPSRINQNQYQSLQKNISNPIVKPSKLTQRTTVPRKLKNISTQRNQKPNTERILSSKNELKNEVNVVQSKDEIKSENESKGSNENLSQIKLPNVKSQETLYEDLDTSETKPKKLKKKEFLFKYNSDKNGLLYFLGTFPNKKKYSNPEELGNVEVFCSSLVEGELSGFVGRRLTSCQTENIENSYLGIDLGEDR